jgi:ATP-binding cassette, subfamily B, bacterial
MSSVPLLSEFSLPSQRQTDRRGPVRWIYSHSRRYWYLVLSMLIGAISNAALAAVVPMLIGQAFNAINKPVPDTAALLPIAFIIAGTQILRGLLQFVRNFSAELLGQRTERDIRDELYVSLLGKSMTFHSLQPVGDTMARATNDVREVNFLFSPGLNLVIGSAVFMIMPLILAPRYDPSLILVPLLFIIGYFLALWQYLHELSPITADVRKAFGNLNTRLAEAIDGIETVKGMAQERNEVERFGVNAKSFRDAYVHQGDVEARFIPLLLLGLAEAGALFQSLVLYKQGVLNIGQVVAFFGMIQLFGFPTFTSLFAYSQVSLGISSARRILDLINRENNLDQNRTGYQGPMRGEIEFRNVTFLYGDDQEPVLENISFKVHPGQTVAIVGQTGSGKTTLVKLVNRTYDVSSGQVLVDGVDVRDWNLETLRRGISIIEQDIFLFSRKISDNISFGNPEATMSSIENAANAAQAHEFITSFQESYDTVIGERGVTLSGGQRQRLALARAFLTDPLILVLDDSTSAIDSATEDRIQRAIFAAAQGRTTIIITHRLSQIRWADLILVIRQGRLVASGTHEDLLRSSEAYGRIFTEGWDRNARIGD